MTKNELTAFFDERHLEIKAYVDLLQNVEDAARWGSPRFKGTEAVITAQQKNILSSGLYLQLYNLVEATVSRCLESIAREISASGRGPGDLNPELRREWVRAIARTHGDLNPGKRLDAAIEVCEYFLNQLPVAEFKIEAGGGGNWDDSSIEKICDRVGCNLVISDAVSVAAKRRVRDDMGSLKLVKNRRNNLAHGSLSFADCSDGIAVSELRELANAVGAYLEETVNSFNRFIELEIRGKLSGSIESSEAS